MNAKLNRVPYTPCKPCINLYKPDLNKLLKTLNFKACRIHLQTHLGGTHLSVLPTLKLPLLSFLLLKLLLLNLGFCSVKRGFRKVLITSFSKGISFNRGFRRAVEAFVFAYGGGRRLKPPYREILDGISAHLNWAHATELCFPSQCDFLVMVTYSVEQYRQRLNPNHPLIRRKPTVKVEIVHPGRPKLDTPNLQTPKPPNPKTLNP